MKKIGVITSGGDCGGLNAIIKGVSTMANSKGLEVVVIPNGYAGLYNLIDIETLATLTPSRLELFSLYAAGSEAGHSRVKIKKIKDPNKYKRIKEGMMKFGIDALVISGGDDTGSVMVDLSQNGIQCVHAPKTMDLDLQTYSVGGDSTINRIAHIVHDLQTTGRTHNRIIITEVFGRYTGHTAFRGGIAAEADCILIPEIPVDWDIVYNDAKTKYMARIRASDVKAGTYTIVVAEGIKNVDGSEIVDELASVDSFGHKKLAGASKYAREQLEKRMEKDPDIRAFMKETGQFVENLYEIPEVREVTPGHLVRSGSSSAYDVSFGLQAGAAAVLLLLEGKSGVTVCDIANGEIRYLDSAEAIKPRHVNLEEIALYEMLGINFGRKPVEFTPAFAKVGGSINRIY